MQMKKFCENFRVYAMNYEWEATQQQHTYTHAGWLEDWLALTYECGFISFEEKTRYL